MAFVRLAFFPGADQHHFDALAALLSEAPLPRERLLFTAGPVDGGWQVVQVWSSESALAAFNRDHFLPALRTLGPGAFPAPPTVTDFVPTWLQLADEP